MPAFSTNAMFTIGSNVRTLFGRLRVASAKRLTNDQFLQLFVPPEHHEAFRTVGPLMSHQYAVYCNTAHYGWVNGTGLIFVLNHGAGAPLPMPKKLTLQHTAPPELVKSITDWTELGGNAARDAGRIMAVLEFLNKKCSRNEIRFIWPSLLPLLTVNKKYGDLCDAAKELVDVKVPRNSIELPAGLREAMRKTAETVAVMGLLPEEITEKPESAQVTVSVNDGGEFEELGIGKYAGLYP